MRDPDRTRVVEVHVDRPLEQLVLPEGVSRACLVVRLGRSVVGHAVVAGGPVVPASQIRSAILDQLGEVVWREILDRLVPAALGVGPPTGPAPGVTVIVTVSGENEGLPSCLASLAQLETPPHEIVVLAGESGLEEVRAAAAGCRVETLARRADRARFETSLSGDILAFVDAGCTVEPHWLDGIGPTFADPLVHAVKGYTGVRGNIPPAAARPVSFEPTVVDAIAASPVLSALSYGGPANTFVRRDTFTRLELSCTFAGSSSRSASEQLYGLYRILDVGYRVAFDPARIVWREGNPPAEVGSAAVLRFAARCLLRNGELAALPVLVRPRRTRPIKRARDRRLATARVGGGAIRILDGRLMPRVRISAPSPDVSVVIPSRNRRERLLATLRGLGSQSLPADRFEVVVVVDGSTDGSVEAARSLSKPYELRVVAQEHLGRPATRNRGAREALRPLLVFLDDDIVPAPRFLVEHAESHREGVRQLAVFGYSHPVVTYGRLWELVLRAWWHDCFRELSRPDHVWTFMDYSGGNCSVRRDLFLDCGGFDERFKCNEDLELGIRMLERGALFRYRAEAAGDHHMQATLVGALAYQRSLGYHDVLLGQKHPRVRHVLAVSGFFRAEGKLSRRAEIVYRHSRLTEPAATVGPLLASLLERARARGRWRQLVDHLLAHSYFLGVKDALPTLEDMAAFASADSTPQTPPLEVDLASARSLVLPQEGEIGRLRVSFRGAPLAELDPVEPSLYWRWDRLAERIAATSLEPVRRAVPLEEALDLLEHT